MYAYDYRECITDDIIGYLRDRYTDEELREKLADDCDSWREELYDDLWVDDGVTGNASGSYTFNTYEAEENLCHNLDLLHDACDEFCQDAGQLIFQGAEACDVTIRCHLLDECLSRALDEIEELIQEG